MARFASEMELAAAVAAWLRSYGWEVYQEVQLRHGAGVADLVATRRGVVWVIETKLSLSLALLEQGANWLGTAHLVSVAVPRPRRQPRGYAFAAAAARSLGLGWIEVSGDGVGERVKPAILRQARAGEVLAALRENHKTYAPAGNARSRRWTPFQETCEQLRRAAAAAPGQLLADAVAGIQHHYRSDSAARAALARWLRAGVVSGVHLRSEGGRLRVYPDVGWH